jgi:hypothetical protein
LQRAKFQGGSVPAEAMARKDPVKGLTMRNVYISNSGDDKNDGLTPETAAYSWKRALKIHGGRNDMQMSISPEAFVRIAAEIILRKVKH